jgi:ketosteroid isomerase-like protein
MHSRNTCRHPGTYVPKIRHSGLQNLTRAPPVTRAHLFPSTRNRRATRTAFALAAFLIITIVCAARPTFAHIQLPTGGGRHSEEMKQIEALETKWQAAILSADSEAVSDLLADSYVGIGPDGTISTKAEDLQSRTGGQQIINSLNVEDRKIRIFGTTAVVTSKVRVRGMYGGLPLLGEYRYTRVWNLEHGKWQIVSFEANRVHDFTARRR